MPPKPRLTAVAMDDENFLYDLDQDGDIARKRRARG